jgi:uncharacterized protein YjbI with pentapeptide repeats
MHAYMPAKDACLSSRHTSLIDINRFQVYSNSNRHAFHRLSHRHTSLTGLHLTGLRLTGMHLTGLCLTGLHLTGLRLTGLRLTGLRLTGLRLTGLRLTGIHLLQACISRRHVPELCPRLISRPIVPPTHPGETASVHNVATRNLMVVREVSMQVLPRSGSQ